MVLTFLLLALLIAVVSLAAGELALSARKPRRRARPIDYEAWARRRRRTRPGGVEEGWK